MNADLDDSDLPFRAAFWQELPESMHTAIGLDSAPLA
jgi:hypothetical protein